MRKLSIALSAAALVLAACSSGTTEAPDAVKEVVKETVEASKAVSYTHLTLPTKA